MSDDKDYYIANRDYIINRVKNYYINNKEAKLQYQREYSKNSKTITCPCGSTFKEVNKYNHYKCKRHINYLAAGN